MKIKNEKEKVRLTSALQSRLTLYVVVAMSFMATLDSSIVNVALPVMSDKMSVPLSSIEWVAAGYSLVICSTLLFFGRLGDIVGKVKVFQCGTVVFTAASLLCGLCHAFLPLMACRFLQGVGASAYMANNQGIITELFPKEGRGKALGVLGAAVALGTMIGPPAGGLILSALNWNFIFFTNVPIGVLVFVIGRIYLPKSAGKSGKMDIAGAILQFAGTTLLFGALIYAQKTGFTNPLILAATVLAIILIAMFIYAETRCRQPLLGPGLFKNQLFSLSLVCAFLSFICISASIILLPFYLQDTLKLTPAEAGLFLMLSPLVIAALSPLCGALSDKIGSETMTLAGLLVMAGGFFLMSLLQEHSFVLVCAVFVSVTAVGQSLFQPANNSLIMSECPKEKLGIAGSINALMRNLGQVVGIVLSTTLLYSFMSFKLGYSVTDYVNGRDDVFMYAVQNNYRILTAVCMIGALFTALRLLKSRKTREANAVGQTAAQSIG